MSFPGTFRGIYCSSAPVLVQLGARMRPLTACRRDRPKLRPGRRHILLQGLLKRRNRSRARHGVGDSPWLVETNIRIGGTWMFIHPKTPQNGIAIGDAPWTFLGLEPNHASQHSFQKPDPLCMGFCRFSRKERWKEWGRYP